MSEWGDIRQVALPLPFPLKIINAYVIQGSDGYTLIDTGLNTEKSIAQWEESQAKDGWQWSDVTKIVLTHYHPDHYGLAGTLQEKTQAPVYISKTDWEQAQLFFARESEMPESMAAFFVQHGLDLAWAKGIPDHLRGFQRWVEPHPEPTFLTPGESIRLGDREYDIIHTPGHADGHLSFFDRDRGWLLGGDALLPRITPNISLWPHCDPDPLGTYLHTLDQLEKLPITQIFPSHGAVFTHFHERMDQLRDHHAARLNKVIDYLTEHSIASAYEVCIHLFGNELSIHNLRFALSETLAHLEYMVFDQQLDRLQERDQIRYRIR